MQICITELLRLHESAINTCHRFGRILNVYNVKICNISTELLGFLFTEIHNRQQYAYKLNISCGYVLANKETGELFYYGPSQNNQLVFKSPTLLRTRNDYYNCIQKLDNIILEDFLIRPNSRFRLIRVTNITYYVYKCVGIPIGTGANVPYFLQRRLGIHCFITNVNTNRPFNDNLCLFRSLAYHKLKRLRGLERATKAYCLSYCNRFNLSFNQFEGVHLTDLERFCVLFKVYICVYTQDISRHTTLVWRSDNTFQDTMDLDYTLNHFSYINDIDNYSYCFRYYFLFFLFFFIFFFKTIIII